MNKTENSKKFAEVIEVIKDVFSECNGNDNITGYSVQKAPEELEFCDNVCVNGVWLRVAMLYDFELNAFTFKVDVRYTIDGGGAFSGVAFPIDDRPENHINYLRSHLENIE